MGFVLCGTGSNPAREHRRPAVNPVRGVVLGEMLPHGKNCKLNVGEVFLTVGGADGVCFCVSIYWTRGERTVHTHKIIIIIIKIKK